MKLWGARTRWALNLFRAPCRYLARMSTNMGERCWKGKREVKLWPARTRPHFSCTRARISASMRGTRLKWKRTGNYGEREKWWALPLLLKHPSCTHARTSASMRGGRLKGKRTGNYSARENDGRFPSFSRTLHVLARACQLVCVEGI